VKTYKGIAYPFSASKVSVPAAVTDEELIRQSVTKIVTTPRGARVMRPGFGTKVYSYVFESDDGLLAELIRTDITAAVGRYEPRVALRDIQVEREDTSLIITIYYVLIATRTSDSVTIELPIA